MKLQLAQVPPVDHIKAILEHHLPTYRYSVRLGRMVDCQKSFFTGATIVPKRDGIVINGNFPSAGASMVFTLLMLLTGILIMLIVWLAVFRSGQNRVRDEVARTLAPVLGAQLPPNLLAQGQPQLQQGYPQHQQGYPQQHHQQPQQGYPQQHQQQPQGFAAGTRVLVTAQDGQRYPATIAQAAQGQYLCTMPDGNSYWFPQQNVAAA